MDLQSSLPIIIVLGVAGFLLGNMFALKPKASEVRTADFRLLARQFGFNPKLITRPDWLPAQVVRQSHHAPKSDFVASYAIVCDDWQLPLVRCHAKNGCWETISKHGQMLNNIHIELPDSITPHVLGLQARANGVVLYWHDGRYQLDKGAQKLDKNQAQADLQTLKQHLTALANQLAHA